jgi:transposase-like protein
MATEAAITDDSQAADPIARLCTDLQDAQIVRAAVERASGKSWKLIADALQVDESTLYRWRQEHPIDAMAAQFALEVAQEGLLKMSSAFSESAQFVVDMARGKVSIPEGANVDTPQRFEAAREVMTRVLKAAEVATARGGKHRSRVRELDDDALERAARAVVSKRGR